MTLKVIKGSFHVILTLCQDSVITFQATMEIFSLKSGHSSDVSDNFEETLSHTSGIQSVILNPLSDISVRLKRWRNIFLCKIRNYSFQHGNAKEDTANQWLKNRKSFLQKTIPFSRNISDRVNNFKIYTYKFRHL